MCGSGSIGAYSLLEYLRRNKLQLQLLPRISQERRLLFLLLILCQALPVSAEIPFSKGVLFQVQRGIEPPSFLFGTMHSDDPEILKLPVEVEAALAASHTLVLETSMDPLNLMAAMALMISDRENDLQGVLGTEAYQLCVEAAQEMGIPESVLPFYQLWALAVLLSTPPPGTGQFLDLMLHENALRAGKSIKTLETAEEQLKGLSGLSLEDQTALLKDALSSRGELPMAYERLKRAYLARDLGALVTLSREGYEQTDLAQIERFEEALIYARNRRMGKRLETILANGGVFTAIGALHLPGVEGVLQELRKTGFRVERVY